jgi:hypothetical protein
MTDFYGPMFSAAWPLSAASLAALATEDASGMSLKVGDPIPNQTLQMCQQLCATDNGFYTVTDAGVTTFNQLTTYSPDPANDHSGFVSPPTYRCAGFTWDGTAGTPGTCQMYSSGALPLLDSLPDGTPGQTSYYDMKCQNGGTRNGVIPGGAATHYCQCIQPVPAGANDDDPTIHTRAMYEGERCTVPMSGFFHTNEVHGNFVAGAAPNTVQQTPMNPAQQRWRRAHPGPQPSLGYNVDAPTGVPLPLAAVVLPSASLAAGAAPEPLNGYVVVPSSVSAASASGVCTKSPMTGLYCSKGKDCGANCPPLQTPANVSLVALSVDTDAARMAVGTSAVGAAATTVDAGDLKTGTTDGTNFCGTSATCGNCTQSGGGGASNACTANREDFDIAAKAFQTCIDNGRAMIHQDGVNRNQVSTWSAAQQSSLNQLLASGANTTCQTYNNTSSGAGVGIGSWGVGGFSSSSTQTGAIGCEALFETSQALSEYNATLNCTLNSVRNCQDVSVCAAQKLNGSATINGNNNKVTINQGVTQNVFAGANYTNQLTNSFANSTQQSITSVIHQMNTQIQDMEAAGSIPFGGGDATTLPSQGAREFSNLAAAISNITENAVSNQIDNSQIVNVTAVQDLTFSISFIGDNNTLDVDQSSNQHLQVSEITSNNINNSFSNATTQILTATTTQGNNVKNPLTFILIAVAVVLLIGAAVAAFFVGKFALGVGKKVFGKKPSAAQPIKVVVQAAPPVVVPPVVPPVAAPPAIVRPVVPVAP